MPTQSNPKMVNIPVEGAGRSYVRATMSSMGEPMLDWDEVRENEKFLEHEIKGTYPAGMYLRRKQ
jgi:hypothetical protein